MAPREGRNAKYQAPQARRRRLPAHAAERDHLASQPHSQEAGMMNYPDYDDYGTRDQVGYGLGPGDCPACGAPPGEQHGCSLADRSSVTGRHPEVTVQLTGTDGSASAVMGRVQRALRDAGAPQREVDQFRLEATSGDQDHLLQTCMHWVDVT